MTDLQKWLDYGYKEVYAPEAEQMMLAALRAVVELCDHDGRHDVTGDEMASDILRAIEKEVLR